MNPSRFERLSRFMAYYSLAFSYLALHNGVFAQRYAKITTSEEPLVLKSRGSFFVGGESVYRTVTQVGHGLLEGNLTVNQMYVGYMIPAEQSHSDVVLVHGDTLSGKSYETTPDGRMGWDEWFVRSGRGVFNVDLSTRGRSGFDPAAFNDVRAGLVHPDTQPRLYRCEDDICSWVEFRTGPEFGTQYPGNQFPVEAIFEFSKQNVPSVKAASPNPNVDRDNLLELADELEGNAFVLAHSFGGQYPPQVIAKNPDAYKGYMLVEGSCSLTWNDEQLDNLAKVPQLYIWGDNIRADTGVAGFNWGDFLDACTTYAEQINARGGSVLNLVLPDIGVHGNTHCLMMDRNSHQVAAILNSWMEHIESGAQKPWVPGTGIINRTRGSTSQDD